MQRTNEIVNAGRYLRKSRAEDGMDVSEVLARHRLFLDKWAAEHGVNIIEDYPEVVTGESLALRPEMLRLLDDVESGRIQAVLCMDIDRLSRGRMRDQGLIIDTLRDAGCVIVTPEKIYDLNDELDEESVEFKTFMSRREYKIINKRLSRGKRQTVEDGCYIANAPYGYRNVTIDRRPTLEIVEEEAAFVRMIFDMYSSGVGCTIIKNHINALGAKPNRGRFFSRGTVSHILKNPVYIGIVAWNRTQHIRKGTRGSKKDIIIPKPREQWVYCAGRHPAIIDEKIFNAAQVIMKERYIPSKRTEKLVNALAGVITCANCGNKMQLQSGEVKGGPRILCIHKGCMISSKYEYVEQSILQHLQEELAEIEGTRRPKADIVPKLESQIETAKKESDKLLSQREKLYDFLESGVYDAQTFSERMATLKEKIEATARRIEILTEEITAHESRKPEIVAAKIRNVLDAYHAADIEGKNALLKGVIASAIYSKEPGSKPRGFTLALTLKNF